MNMENSMVVTGTELTDAGVLSDIELEAVNGGGLLVEIGKAVLVDIVVEGIKAGWDAYVDYWSVDKPPYTRA
jgi:hypothetical protein